MNARWLAGLLAVLALPGCGAGVRADQRPTRSEVTVSAAASLNVAFRQLEPAFEAAHPGAALTFNTGASSSLAEQIVRGAPVDLFASADAPTMDRVVNAGAADGSPRVFARNILQIAVPKGNPGGVRGLADLARPELVVALCAEQVPCGRAAQRLLAAARVQAAPDTFEQDATATITKVRLREVDAALVYRTDVLAAGDDVTGIDVPERPGALNDYLIVKIKDGSTAPAVDAFLDYVLSPAGQAVLADAGFRTP